MIDYCGGHPYLLSILKEKAKLDITYTAQVANLSDLDLEADAAISTRLFPAEFRNLTDLQRNVLLAIGLYDQEISLKALYQVWVCLHCWSLH